MHPSDIAISRGKVVALASSLLLVAELGCGGGGRQFTCQVLCSNGSQIQPDGSLTITASNQGSAQDRCYFAAQDERKCTGSFPVVSGCSCSPSSQGITEPRVAQLIRAYENQFAIWQPAASLASPAVR